LLRFQTELREKKKKKDEKFSEFVEFFDAKTTDQTKQKPTIKHTLLPQRGLLLSNNQPKL